MKRFFALTILLGFMGGAILSFSAMGHSKEGTMEGDCPITALPISVCPEGALSAVTHYILMYQAFTNGLVSSTVTQVLAIVLLFVAVAYVLRGYLTPIQHLFILSRDYVAKLYRPRSFTRWLSLLVNSPSFN